MPTDFFDVGQFEIYNQLGIIKEGFVVPKGIGRVGKVIASKIPGIKKGIKRFLIGNPKRFMSEFERKKLLAPGSTLREGFAAPGLLNKALLYGFPAMETVNIMRDPEAKGNRAERIGGLLGGTALGLAAWGPTGMLGSAAAGSLGEYLGRGLGRTAKYITRQTPRVNEMLPTDLTLGYQQKTPYTWR